MKDPSRLLDEPGTDSLQASLLRIARSEGPSGEGRQRILAGLGVGVVGGMLGEPSSAAQGAFSHTVSSAALKWGTAGVVALGATLAALFSLQTKPHEVRLAVARATADVVAPTAAEAGSVDLVPVTKLEDLPTLAYGADAPKNVGAPSLAEEVAAIKSAKAALASGNAAQALRELDGYKTRFPRGRLAQEATVVRIEALIREGDASAAESLAERFLASHANSPYATRVRTLISR